MLHVGCHKTRTGIVLCHSVDAQYRVINMSKLLSDDHGSEQSRVKCVLAIGVTRASRNATCELLVRVLIGHAWVD